MKPLWLLHIHEEECNWLLVDDSRTILEGPHSGKIKSAKTAIQNDPVCLLLPTEHCLVRQITFPKINSKPSAEMAAFALESITASQIEALHVVVGSQLKNKNWLVGYVEKALLQELLEKIGANQMNIVMMLPEWYGLPWQEGKISICKIGEQLLVRQDENEGFMADPEWVNSIINPQYEIHDCGEIASLSKNQNATKNTREYDFPLRHIPLSAPILFNQGLFRKKVSPIKIWNKTKLPVAIATLGVFLFTAALGIDTWKLNNKLTSIQNDTETFFHASFPNISRIVNLEHQAQEAIKAIKSEEKRALLWRVLNELARLKPETDLKLLKLQYNQKTGVANLHVETPDYLSMESLEKNIGNQLHVKLVNTSRKDVVTANFIIREAP